LGISDSFNPSLQAYSNRITEESAQELGIRRYIEKPIERETLARSVQEVLDYGPPSSTQLPIQDGDAKN